MFSLFIISMLIPKGPLRVAINACVAICIAAIYIGQVSPRLRFVLLIALVNLISFF